jgi:hypothetical protein
MATMSSRHSNPSSSLTTIIATARSRGVLTSIEDDRSVPSEVRVGSFHAPAFRARPVLTLKSTIGTYK